MIGRRSGPAALLAIAALAAGCGEQAPSVPAPAPLSRDFLGIVSEDAFARPGAYRDAQLHAQARAGIGLVRQTFSWKAIEKRRGHYALGTYDGFVADAARAGMSVLPILFDTPAFYARTLPRGGDPRATAPPADPATMARFATALVRRYGPDGTLWREQPDLPRHPITAWQVWNEPNLPVYWRDQPSASEYTRLLRAVAGALHGADPRAQVVTAGLPQSKLGIPFETYVKAMYAAGAQGAFDVLAVNAYSRYVTGMEAALAGARRIMASAQDGDVPIWVTEFGWATRPGPKSTMTVGPKTQARLLSSAVATLVKDRQRLGLRGIVYYGWKDADPYPGGKDFWGLHTGLVSKRGTAKPALRALRVASRAARATPASS